MDSGVGKMIILSFRLLVFSGAREKRQKGWLLGAEKESTANPYALRRVPPLKQLYCLEAEKGQCPTGKQGGQELAATPMPPS